MKAKIVSEDDCIYPKCEECENYKTLDNKKFCAVPVVLTKQDVFVLETRLNALESEIDTLNEVLK